MTERAPHIAGLTPLRGIAALLVVAFHLDSIGAMFQLGPFLPWTGFLARGYLWVDFFFVLSGFILSHVYGADFRGGVRLPAVRSFAGARFARIVPMHLAALAFTVLSFLATPQTGPPSGPGGAPPDPMMAKMMAQMHDWRYLPGHVFLLLSFGLVPMSWNVPGWSIAAEWWTYFLTLPLHRLIDGIRIWVPAVIALGCCASLGTMAAVHPSARLDITFDLGLLRCLLGFTIGLCLHRWHRAGITTRFLASDLALAIAAVASVLVLHFPLPPNPLPMGKNGMPAPIPGTPLADGLAPLLFAALVAAVAANTGRAVRFLEIKPLAVLGNLSYAIYLMQSTAFAAYFIPAMAWRGSHPTGPMPTPMKLLLLALVLIITIGLAALAHRFVEKPSRNALRRRLGVSAPG
ncbi:MAG: acyltransferase family protein [Armatimonadota bacterium]